MVVLVQDIRADDVQRLKQAIEMLRNVLSVEANVSTSADLVAETRARYALAGKIREFLEPEKA
jgi:hypothetical protein